MSLASAWKSPSAVKKKAGSHRSLIGRILALIFGTIGAVLRTLIAVIRRFTLPLLAVACGVLVFALFLSWLAATATVVVGSPFLSLAFGDLSFWGYLFVVAVLIIITVPTLATILFFMRMFFRKRVRPRVHYALWGIWGLAFIGMAAIGSVIGTEFSSKSNFSHTNESFSLSNDTLQLELFRPQLDDGVQISTDALYSNFDGTWIRNVKFNIHPSGANEQLTLETELSSHGRDMEQAQAFAKALIWQPAFAENRLQLPAYYKLERPTPFRNQLLTVTIKVPDGIYVQFLDDQTIEAKFGTSLTKGIQWRPVTSTHGHREVTVTTANGKEALRQGEIWQSKDLAM